MSFVTLRLFPICFDETELSLIYITFKRLCFSVVAVFTNSSEFENFSQEPFSLRRC